MATGRGSVSYGRITRTDDEERSKDEFNDEYKVQQKGKRVR